jgi:transcriptional regulator with XRE-family HTH domain
MIETLVDARQRAGLTQRELAERLHRSHSFVGKLESGERQLDLLEFCEYAEILGVDAANLLRRILKRAF